MQESALSGIVTIRAIPVNVMARNRTQRPPSREDQLQRLRSYGVEVRQEGDKWLTQRGPCVATLEIGPDGLRVCSEPGYRLGNELAVFFDGGYQKFLKTPTRKVPATAEHLKAIHSFQEALCEALGEECLYNISLGTVSSTYQYDRVKGRPN